MNTLALGCGAAGLAAGPALDVLARATVGVAPASRTLRAGTALLTAAGAALVALHVDPLLPARLWLLALGVALTVTDLTARRLPNVLLGPGAVGLAVLLGAGAVLDGRATVLVGSVVAAGALFTGFLLVAPAGLGAGDVKLVGVLGLPLGLAGAGAVVVAVVLALAAHVAVSVALLAVRRVGLRTALPLGPALLVGTAAALGWFSPLLG